MVFGWTGVVEVQLLCESWAKIQIVSHSFVNI